MANRRATRVVRCVDSTSAPRSLSAQSRETLADRTSVHGMRLIGIHTSHKCTKWVSLLFVAQTDLSATFRTGLHGHKESTTRSFIVKAEADKTLRGRLTADTLRRISPRHLHRAVHRLLEGDLDHPFGRSTGYRLVTPDGRRVPPKAAFGLAIEEALGISVRPNDFYGGEHTPCFAAIRKAGYRIARKGDDCPVPHPGSGRECVDRR